MSMKQYGFSKVILFRRRISPAVRPIAEPATKKATSMMRMGWILYFIISKQIILSKANPQISMKPLKPLTNKASSSMCSLCTNPAPTDEHQISMIPMQREAQVQGLEADPNDPDPYFVTDTITIRRPKGVAGYVTEIRTFVKPAVNFSYRDPPAGGLQSQPPMLQTGKFGTHSSQPIPQRNTQQAQEQDYKGLQSTRINQSSFRSRHEEDPRYQSRPIRERNSGQEEEDSCGDGQCLHRTGLNSRFQQIRKTEIAHIMVMYRRNQISFAELMERSHHISQALNRAIQDS